MRSETLLYIALAGIVALVLAYFYYVYKNKSRPKLSLLFAFLRFVTIFSILLLVINPTFNQVSTTVEKPNLVVAVDNSSSIKHLKQDVKARGFIKKLKSNADIQKKFNVNYYTFGEYLKASDSISFLENKTDISGSFSQLNEIYKQTVSPTILISDGNQTYGNDYQFLSNNYKQSIYPVILGDTITYTDLKIEQLNVNKYAYLKNKFPVEVILVYTGNNSKNTKFVVKNGNATVFSQNVTFSSLNNSKIINFTLPASGVGVRNYKATILPLSSEKNTINNSKNFAVEVINQKTKIAVVSDFSHPDLGALKKSIESNEQRFVSILNTKEVISKINDFQLIILYQPNNKFKLIFDKIETLKKNKLIIIGPKTNLQFLNKVSKNYKHEITKQTESYQVELNSNYAPFAIRDLGFESFPPLLSNYGEVNFNVPFQTILNKKINGIVIDEPLLASIENQGVREVVLFGENIWQWRAQNFIIEKSFNNFDNFLGKLVQYLSSNQKKNRLNIQYESFYNGNSDVTISAEFFDKNYIFDRRETLSITVKDDVLKSVKTFPLVLKNNNYQVNLSNLPPSSYSFTVKAKNKNITKSGNFQILDYNVEQQYLNADVLKLQKLAKNSNGSSYFIDDHELIINELLTDNRYVPIQKSSKNSIPLVDFKYLLIIIVLCLGLEWFLRKYNGLI